MNMFATWLLKLKIESRFKCYKKMLLSYLQLYKNSDGKKYVKYVFTLFLMKNLKQKKIIYAKFYR